MRHLYTVGTKSEHEQKDIDVTGPLIFTIHAVHTIFIHLILIPRTVTFMLSTYIYKKLFNCLILCEVLHVCSLITLCSFI